MIFDGPKIPLPFLFKKNLYFQVISNPSKFAPRVINKPIRPLNFLTYTNGFGVVRF